MKQISRVLAAVAAGKQTSFEIARTMRLPVSLVSAYLHQLVADGFIRVVGSTRLHRTGRPSKQYIKTIRSY